MTTVAEIGLVFVCLFVLILTYFSQHDTKKENSKTEFPRLKENLSDLSQLCSLWVIVHWGWRDS